MVIPLMMTFPVPAFGDQQLEWEVRLSLPSSRGSFDLWVFEVVDSRLKVVQCRCEDLEPKQSIMLTISDAFAEGTGELLVMGRTLDRDGNPNGMIPMRFIRRDPDTARRRISLEVVGLSRYQISANWPFTVTTLTGNQQVPDRKIVSHGPELLARIHAIDALIKWKFATEQEDWGRMHDLLVASAKDFGNYNEREAQEVLRLLSELHEGERLENNSRFRAAYFWFLHQIANGDAGESALHLSGETRPIGAHALRLMAQLLDEQHADLTEYVQRAQIQLFDSLVQNEVRSKLCVSLSIKYFEEAAEDGTAIAFPEARTLVEQSTRCLQRYYAYRYDIPQHQTRRAVCQMIESNGDFSAKFMGYLHSFFALNLEDWNNHLAFIGSTDVQSGRYGAVYYFWFLGQTNVAANC